MKLNRLALPVVALGLATGVPAQNPAPAAEHAAQMAAAVRGEAKAMVAGKAVTIDYGRPELKGRDMLGQAKPGTPWRMGKDAATTLVTEAELAFGSQVLAKGRYVLTAVKGEDGNWTMIATTAGADKTATRIPLTTTATKESVETFTIELSAKGNAGELALMWGTAKLAAAFTGK